jgi:hypothetical protein
MMELETWSMECELASWRGRSWKRRGGKEREGEKDGGRWRRTRRYSWGKNE